MYDLAYEDSYATWMKRFLQRHYSYRDFQSATTAVEPATAAAIAAQTYVFGTNARGTNVLGGGNIYSWPMSGDWVGAFNTYARYMMIQAQEDAWISFISENPYYLILRNQGISVAELAGRGISATITEEPQFIVADTLITFYPTLAKSIVYWYDTVADTIRIWAEGNMEGNE